MKSSLYLFVIAAAGVALSTRLNAEVAKPQFESSQNLNLPAIWRSSSASQRLKTLRVAQLDAYRALIERVYGFQIVSGTSVYDCVLQSDIVRTRLSAVLKGATELEKPQYTEQGMVMVVYGLKLRKIIEILKMDKSFDTLTITKSIEHQDKIIEALGCGALPDSMGVKMLRAKRAAELDAYRLMAERIVGVRINSKTTVANLCLLSDKVQASLVAFLKGLKPSSIKYKADGSCAVTVQLKIREVVKTLEGLVRIYNSGIKDKISSVNITTNDKIFKVTGNGAPRDITAYSANYISSGKSILLKIIRKEIVVE